MKRTLVKISFDHLDCVVKSPPVVNSAEWEYNRSLNTAVCIRSLKPPTVVSIILTWKQSETSRMPCYKVINREGSKKPFLSEGHMKASWSLKEKRQ